MTDNNGAWLLYDGDCRRCTRLAQRHRRLLESRGFGLAPLQTPWVRVRLRIPEGELPAEMKVLAPDGTVTGGADALLYLARFFWWAWPLRVLGELPGAKHLLRAAYRWGARRRHCARGACAVSNGPGQVSAHQKRRNHHRASDFFTLP
jgi:predicted DCC family thiol-disulfide oxidoreductase YuxK